MKALIVAAFLVYAMPALAVEIDTASTNLQVERYVADALEVETLPGGGVAMRLVSTRRVTAAEFWVNSIYGSRDSIVILQGNDTYSQQLDHARRRNAMAYKAVEQRPLAGVD